MVWVVGRKWGGGGVGGGTALGRFLWLSSVLLLLLTNVPEVTAPITIQCVQFGQSSRDGPYTIGAYALRPEDRESMRSSWSSAPETFNDPKLNGPCRNEPKPGGYRFDKPSNNGGFAVYWDMCPRDMKVRPYLVKQNGKVLNGWLQIEVEVMSDEINMDFAYVQVRDEWMNAIGEFVTDPNEQCTTGRDDLFKPSKYQYLPCSAIGAREPKASQGILVASRNQYDYKNRNPEAIPLLPTQTLKRGFQVTWRLNEYWCNRHQKFRIDAEIWTSLRSVFLRQFPLGPSEYDQHKCLQRDGDGEDCRLQRKATDWLYPKWFGAADIKIPGSLTCDTLALWDPVREEGIGLTPAAQNDSWFYDATEVKYEDDYLSKDKTYTQGDQVFVKQCQVDPFPKDGRPKNQIVSFGGRCISHREKVVSHNQLPQCNRDASSVEFQGIDLTQFKSYSTYRDHVIATRKEICEMVCIYPTAADVPDIQGLKSTIANLSLKRGTVSFTTVQNTRVRDRFETSWQTRKYHGNLFIFVTMFLIPVSIFFVRYFKETCMNQMSGGCAYWYWLHLAMSCVVPTLYYSGHAAMHTNLDNFGYSKSPHGELHVLVGRIFIWLYMAMVALGAIRPAPRRALLVCNTLHSIIGFLLYFMCIFLVINSTFIPASPTVHECDKVTGLPIGYSFTARMVSGWFAFDMLCHILLTVAQVVIDRQEKIKRSGCGLPIMPMLPGDHPHDLVGHRFRKLIFGIYVIVSVIFTIVLITVLFNRDDYPEYCVMGEMTCNLKEFRPNQNSSPFGCAKTSLEYYNKVYERYDINVSEVVSSSGE